MLSYWKNCADVSHVGPCWVVLGSMLGLCWAYVGPRTACSTGPLCKGPVEHAIFGLCRGNVGPCWAMFGHVGPCWAAVVPILSFWGPCWGHLSLCWAYVGPRTVCSFWLWNKAKRNAPFWGHVGAMLNLCWAYVGPRTACSTGPLCKGPVEHAIFGLCRGNVGPCWAMLGCCWANVGPWCGKINFLEF